ncbi:MAG: hypothetical protein KAW12_10650 [Candidatus Aminicenantes bacterium]|nr:hypothetical protein [Candidatus Aminicenantes bacterium]
MQFVRKIIDSKRLENVVDLPIEFKGKKIEMLLLPIAAKKKAPKKTFNPREFRGAAKIDEKTLKKQLSELREEWQRFE